jgi:KipI family sensor histidine kinase inhibitor
MTGFRPVRTFGDGGAVADVDSLEEAHGLAAAVSAARHDGIDDVIVGHRSVTVVIDPTRADLAGVGQMLATTVPLPPGSATRPRIDIPVTFDGVDLDEVGHLVSLSPTRVAALLTGTDLQVAFVGFAPGFGYLVGLPPELASVPRRPTPRPSVPGGSVALAGGFAGVYPQASPGGWHLIGHTDMPMFDPESPPYSALRAGDIVRLRQADSVGTPAHSRSTGQRPTLRSDATRTVRVEDAGWLSFVQDRGRLGVAGLGVPRAGGADPYALRLANRMVGNGDDGAVVETTARGPALRFSVPAHVAVVGTAVVSIDGHEVPSGSVIPVAAGQTMTTGSEKGGLRSYIAIAGGIDIARVLGSRSSDVLSGLGVGPLRSGDVLGLGPPGRPSGRTRAIDASREGPTVRIMVGPDVFPSATFERLVSTTWEVGASSNRIGVRLQADRPLTVPNLDIASRGMVTGAIQLPPDGQPIILLNDHATVGGYPVIATVVSADLGLLGQLGPGDPVRFGLVDLTEAVEARRKRERTMDDAVMGWYPVRTD